MHIENRVNPVKEPYVEQWYSNELKLIALVVASSPGETYTVRIQELRREEPDAKLFKVPSEYAIIDLSRGIFQ